MTTEVVPFVDGVALFVDSGPAEATTTKVEGLRRCVPRQVLPPRFSGFIDGEGAGGLPARAGRAALS